MRSNRVSGRTKEPPLQRLFKGELPDVAARNTATTRVRTIDKRDSAYRDIAGGKVNFRAKTRMKRAVLVKVAWT